MAVSASAYAAGLPLAAARPIGLQCCGLGAVTLPQWDTKSSRAWWPVARFAFQGYAES